ncbi:MAG: recombination-associated protein RdgC [bacterium]
MNKLLKGRVSFKVFKPSVQIDSISDVRERVGRYSFKELKASDMRDESTGWVDPLLSFDNELFSSISHGEYLILGMRVDSFSLGAAVMRPHLEKAMYDFKNENNLEYISAQQKKEIQDRVKIKLKGSSVPRTKIVEMAWNHNSGLIYLCTQSKTDVNKFVNLFEKTFDMTISEFSVLDIVEKQGGSAGETILSELWGTEND